MKKKSFYKINQKISIFILFFTLIIFLILIFTFYKLYHHSLISLNNQEILLFKEFLQKEDFSIKNYIDNTIFEFEKNLENELKKIVNDRLLIAQSIFFNNKSKNIPDDVIKTTIIATLRTLWQNEKFESFYILNVNGDFELNLNFLTDNSQIDKFGKNYIREIIKKALMRGKGIVYFYKNKNNTGEQKTTFFKMFRPYNWIIGADVLRNDYLKKLKLKILSTLNYNILPSEVSFIIINKNNQIILSKNFKKNLNFKYEKFIDKEFKIVELGKSRLLTYCLSIIPFKWKLITFSNLADIHKIINKNYAKTKSILLKIFVIFLAIFIVFIGLLFFYFSTINRKFTIQFKRLLDYTNFLSKNKSIEEKNFEYEELQDLYDFFKNIILEIKTEKKISEKITENIDIGLIFLNPDLKIKYVNNAAVEILGYSKDEIIGKEIRPVVGCLDINTKEKISPENCEINQLFAGKKIAHKRVYYTKKDGNIIPVEASFIALRNEENMEKIIIAFKDITEQIKREKELIEAKIEMENALRVKSEFIANISHEIRTPMNAIIGFVDLLLEDDNLTDEQKNYLNIVKESSNNLLNIINDILDFSKIEKGKIDYEIRNFNLKETIEESVNIFKFKAKEKGLEINFSIDKRIPLIIKGDKFRLAQVLNNLISNAIKFTAKGSITILVQLLEKHEDKVKLQFTVADTGIGIDKDKLNKIFDAFSQEDSSITRRFQGTGLGLAICKGIIENLGGKIFVESEKGKGSKFHFILEFEIGDEITLSGKDQIDGDFSDIKLLIVEDDVFNQTFLSEMLKKISITTEIVNNGKEALKKISENDYDLILMDIEMPVMNGMETVKIIRKLENGEKIDLNDISENLKEKLKNKNLKIIALTGYDDEEIIKEIFKVGFNDYIQKPVNFEQLMEKIKKFISKDTLFNDEELCELVGNDEELIKSLKNEFINSLKVNVNKLKKAIREEDFDEISKIAHTIKGAAGNMRVKEIESLSNFIEIAAKEKDLENINFYFNKISVLTKE